MATRFYVSYEIAPYLPSAYQGTWDTTPSTSVIASKLLLDPAKIGPVTSINTVEGGAANPYRAAIFRAISRRLDAQTISGTVDLCIGVREASSASNLYTRLYIYVTVGDSNSVRGVLLNYEEASGSGTEWGTTQIGKSLASAQSLSSLAVTAGDRLVVEFGYTSYATDLATGHAHVGCRNNVTNWTAQSDATVGSNTATRAPWIEFSGTVALAADEPTNIQPENAIDLTTLPYSDTHTPVSNEIALWFKRTAISGDNNYLGAFGGVDATSGLYTPKVKGRLKSGSNYPAVISSQTPEAWRSTVIPTPAAQETYLEVTSDDYGSGVPARNLVLSVEAAPSVATAAGDIFIPRSKSTNDVEPSAILNGTTGAIKQLLSSFTGTETGAMLSDGTIAVSHGTGFDMQTDQEVDIFDADLALLTTTTGLAVGTTKGQRHPPITAVGMNFYFAQHKFFDDAFNPIDLIHVVKFDKTGAILDTWDIDVPTSWGSSSDWLALSGQAGLEHGLSHIGVSADESTLYMTAGFPSGFLANRGVGVSTKSGMADAPIARWDLVNDVALSDLNTLASGYMNSGLKLLSDGNILVQEDKSEMVVGTDDFHVKIYTPAGAVTNTFTYTSSADRQTIAQLAYAPRYSTSSFYIWFQGNRQAAGNGSLTHDIIRVRLSDGTVLNTSAGITGISTVDLGNAQPAGTEIPSTIFGLQASCPMFVLGTEPCPTVETQIPFNLTTYGATFYGTLTGDWVTPQEICTKVWFEWAETITDPPARTPGIQLDPDAWPNPAYVLDWPRPRRATTYVYRAVTSICSNVETSCPIAYGDWVEFTLPAVGDEGVIGPLLWVRKPRRIP